jgi:hypothetical protein
VDEDKDGNKVPTVLMELDDDIIISKVAQDPGKFLIAWGGRGVVIVVVLYNTIHGNCNWFVYPNYVLFFFSCSSTCIYS